MASWRKDASTPRIARIIRVGVMIPTDDRRVHAAYIGIAVVRRAGIVIVTHDLDGDGSSRADPLGACIACGARVRVVTSGGVCEVLAPGLPATKIVGTGVAVIAQGGAALVDPALAVVVPAIANLGCSRMNERVGVIAVPGGCDVSILPITRCNGFGAVSI